MRILPVALLGLAVLGAPGLAAADVVVVDRGLPSANLNNAAGANRSNVAWADNPVPDFFGDNFTLPGGSGTVYTIDTIDTWVVSSDIAAFTSVTLFTGSGNTLTATATNPTITQVTYADGSTYQGTSGSSIPMYQVEFTGLDIVAPAGSTVSFGVEGLGGGYWFNHASNAALSGSPQDSADNVMSEYSWDGVNNPVYLGPYDSNGNGWDKSSDINVRVSAQVPEPASLTLLGVALFGIGAARRRAKAAKKA